MNNSINTSRRRLLGGLVAGTALAGVSAPLVAAERRIKVYKSPTCGCCVDWIDHLEDNGFTVEAFDVGNSEARERLGMPIRYGSCHTGEIDGYAIEGHVPAREVHRLLDEKPQAIGLSVPAMPRGSPGMDGPAYGNVVDPYDVLLIDSDGNASVYQSYR
ncbi:MAG: DUF411 domain-containing protein [Pseudomonadota bacterium]